MNSVSQLNMVKLLLVLALLAAGYFGYSYFQLKSLETVTTFEQCVKSKSAVIMESYPSNCTLPNGKSFIQPLNEDEKRSVTPPQPNNVSSFDECVVAEGSVVTYSYPGTCITAQGKSFTEPISDSP